MKYIPTQNRHISMNMNMTMNNLAICNFNVKYYVVSTTFDSYHPVLFFMMSCFCRFFGRTTNHNHTGSTVVLFLFFSLSSFSCICLCCSLNQFTVKFSSVQFSLLPLVAVVFIVVVVVVVVVSWWWCERVGWWIGSWWCEHVQWLIGKGGIIGC